MTQLAGYALLAVLNVVIQAPVVDQAGVLPRPERAAIAAQVRALREHTGVQLAVLTVLTTQGEPLADFSHRTATAWGGGRKGHDDGLLLTLAVADHKARLEVGYGLEARLPDVTVRRILAAASDDLQQKKYSAAIFQILDQILAQLLAQLDSQLDQTRGDRDPVPHDGGAAATDSTAPPTGLPYPLHVTFRADPVPPPPIPPLGLLVWAPLAGLGLGYALGAWRVRARSTFVDILVYLNLLTVTLVALGFATRDRRGYALALCLGGIGWSSMYVRSCGLTRLGCVGAALLGGLGGLGALLLQYLIQDDLVASIATWQRCLLLTLAGVVVAQALTAYFLSPPNYHGKLWDSDREHQATGLPGSGGGSSGSGWSSSAGGGGGGSSGGDSGGGGSGWSGGGGDFGGGGADISF